MIQATTTIHGKTQVTSVTQYVQFATSTVTTGGEAAVQTQMLVAPAIWSAMGDAANEACGRKRQFCDLSKVTEEELARFVIARLAKQEIVLPTLAVYGLVKWIQSGALNRAAVNKFPILGTPPPSTTSSVESTVTAWMIPYLSDEPDLRKMMASATIPLSASTVSEITTSTSLSCASTSTASVSASLAYENLIVFCGQQDHLVPINPTTGTSQSFPQQEQNATLSVSWSDGCESDTEEYTLSQDDCRTYLNNTINECDVDSDDKHGGMVTAECIVYAMSPQPYVPPPLLDVPSSLAPDLPASTVQSLRCASSTPDAKMFNKDDAVGLIEGLCDKLRDDKAILIGGPPGWSGGGSLVYANNGPNGAPLCAAVVPHRELLNPMHNSLRAAATKFLHLILARSRKGLLGSVTDVRSDPTVCRFRLGCYWSISPSLIRQSVCPDGQPQNTLTSPQPTR